MTITDYVQSLGDNPYFGAGAGIFSLGNKTCSLKIVSENSGSFRCWRCNPQTCFPRGADPLPPPFHDHPRSSLPRQIVLVVAPVDHAERRSPDSASQCRDFIHTKQYRSRQDKVWFHPLHWHSHHVLWRHLDQSWANKGIAHAGSSHGRSMGDSDADRLRTRQEHIFQDAWRSSHSRSEVHGRQDDNVHGDGRWVARVRPSQEATADPKCRTWWRSRRQNCQWLQRVHQQPAMVFWSWNPL